MHDDKDAIIYVGKAKSLTKRVHQYFQASHDEGIRKARMVDQIRRFEYIITDSEMEALVLENNLIKEHRPKYNTMLRDDKTYPYIKVTVQERYPRVFSTRTVHKDRNRYFGPFTSAYAVKDTIDLVQKIYHLRTCSKKFPEAIGKERPCLNYHMKQCMGICTGHVSEEEYNRNVKEALNFLSGNHGDVLNMLREKMEKASETLDFEKAAEYRDLIESVKKCTEKQKVTAEDGEDRDIIAVSSDGEDAVTQVFFVRDGRLIGRDHFFMNVREDDDLPGLISAFLLQYYGGTPVIPRELFLQADIEDRELIEDWLSEKRGGRVHLITPKKGKKEKLVELAEKNAELVLSQDKEKIKKEEGRTIGAMKEISALLDIPGITRLEAYDISNTSGYQSVGSMVVFEKGKPLRSDYRKFRLKTVDGPDDYKSMYEVLSRRFTHGIKERDEKTESSFSRFPDVIMMDGGRGQVNVAKKVLSELKLEIPVCGMVKDDHHRTRGLYYNNVEIPIDTHSEGFKLITRLQDEAHRFAIEYHKSLRGKNQVHSFLDDISGIGATRRRELMKAFDGIEGLREATVERLAEVPSMNRQAAEAVFEYLHNNEIDNEDKGGQENA